MSKLRANIGEAMYSITKWHGLNESPDGDTNLKKGEAAVMRNFRVSDGGALRKRPGTQAVAGLAAEYTLYEGTEEIFDSEIGGSLKTAFGYPEIAVTSVGMIEPVGSSLDINYENYEEHIGSYINREKYWVRFERIFQTNPRLLGYVGESKPEEDCEFASTAGGEYDISSAKGAIYIEVFDEPPTYYNGKWGNDRGTIVKLEEARWQVVGKYVRTASDEATAKLNYNIGYKQFPLNLSGNYALITGLTVRPSGAYDIYTLSYKVYEQKKFNWIGRPVLSETDYAEDPAVKTLWSGYVGGTEYVVAACAGHLWSISEDGGKWAKADIGTLDTNGSVCLFGFGGKLYALDGKSYYVWDGESFGEVEGYVPIVGTASSPDGQTTLLERVNMLTPKRRQRFSANGTSTIFKLAEGDIASVDAVYVDGASVGYSSADLAGGSVTFAQAPKQGSDNVEIHYSAKASLREQVLKMRFSELYNGVNDSRVFLYGDGSNKCIYSEPLYETGAASAEYFPDLNEIGVGESNTPLTSLIRHYDKLLAFKSGGGTFSIRYDSITLPDGNLTAGFYCESVNRDIGNDAMGQAVLVNNQPRTVDGKSIYEWKSAGGGYITNDQRNAERISDKVETTLKNFDLSKATLHFDKLRHEFYCVYQNTAIVQNTDNHSWYVYTAFTATCMINYKDELYIGTPRGFLCHVSDNYTWDEYMPITCYWESGSLSFGKDWMEKYSPEIWVGLAQEENAAVKVGIMTDKDGATFEEVKAPVNQAMPAMIRRRLKGRKFTFYKIIIKSDSAEDRATLSALDIKVKYNIPVK